MKLGSLLNRPLFTKISRRLGREDGFTMLTALMAVMVGTLLSLAAWQTANSDIKFTDKDRWQKLAYQETQSGVSDYVQHIAEASGYWNNCDQPPGFTGDGLGFTALNDTDIGSTGHVERRWLPFNTDGNAADRATNGQYTIDLVPANGATSCKSKTPRALGMIDQSTGSLRVRVTGRAGPAVPANIADSNIEQWRQNNWTRRSVIIELRRNGFLNYGYFTDHESQDPELKGGTPCDAYYQDDPSLTNGRFRAGSNVCGEIQFANGDKLQGPFHTNDSVLLASFGSGSAIFGLNDGDRVEVYNNGDPDCPFRTGATTAPSGNTGNCTNQASASQVQLAAGKKISLVTGQQAKSLLLPEDDDDLLEYANPSSGDPDARGYTFTGRTHITLKNNGTFDVKNDVDTGGNTVNYAYPTSGVIYVKRAPNISLCTANPYGTSYPGIADGCAVAEVEGTYNKSLTIGSADDIVVWPTGITRTSTQSVLGLIANDFVRVRHFGNCSKDVDLTTQPAEQTGALNITAAILTLNRSFTFDNYTCGAKLGNLNVTGSIAQKWRGTVGTSGSPGTGYIKNYVYDYNLKALAPPHFLAPTTSTWLIARTREQVPACACATGG
jgi:hypothetical protein